MVGPQLAVNFDRAHEWVEDPAKSVLVKEYMADLLQKPISIFFRILVAMGEYMQMSDCYVVLSAVSHS